MKITAYAYNAALHCPRCAAAWTRNAQGERDVNGVAMNCRDREGNPIGAAFDEDGYCDTCHYAFGNADQVVRLLSVDALRDADGGWQWNNWTSRGMVPAAWCDLKPRALLRALRESGRFDTAPGRVAIEDDGYNLVIVTRGTREPLGALAYGETP